MPSQSHEVPPVSAPFPIRRPYPEVFLALRDRMSALLETMETGSAGSLPPAGRQMDSEEWEAHRLGIIMGRLDWDAAFLSFRWAINEDDPTPAERSPCYDLDLSALKLFALETVAPRDCFESYALFLLSAAQDHFGISSAMAPRMTSPSIAIWYSHRAPRDGPASLGPQCRFHLRRGVSLTTRPVAPHAIVEVRNEDAELTMANRWLERGSNCVCWQDLAADLVAAIDLLESRTAQQVPAEDGRAILLRVDLGQHIICLSRCDPGAQGQTDTTESVRLRFSPLPGATDQRRDDGASPPNASVDRAVSKLPPTW